MDTRRRSDNREQMSAPPSTGPQPGDDELGSETRVVRLSDGQPVGRRTGGMPPIAIVFIVAAAILGFGVGAGFQNMTPIETPTAAPVAAVASPSQVPDRTLPADASALPTPPPTSSPSAPPPWAWSRSELLPDELSSAVGAWGLGSRIVVVGHRDAANGVIESWETATLEPGRAWRSVLAPRLIEDLAGGSVIGGRLTFLARTTGIDLHRQWQVISTGDGATWDGLAPAQGLGDFDAVRFLVRAGSTWLIATDSFDDGGNDTQRLARSSDGVAWTDVSLPDVGGIVEVNRAAVLGSSFILSLRAGTNDANPEAVLTSSDGITWHAAAVPSSLQSATDVTCGERTCVLTGFEFEVPSMPAAWISTDGAHWVEATTRIEDHGGGGLYPLTTLPDGFLALEVDPRLAWLGASDGMTWRSFDALPADTTDSIGALAVAGDTIIALADGPDGRPVVWRGNVLSFGP